MRGFLPGIRSENMLHLRYDTGASAGVRLRNVICYVTVRDTVKQWWKVRAATKDVHTLRD